MYPSSAATHDLPLTPDRMSVAKMNFPWDTWLKPISLPLQTMQPPTIDLLQPTETLGDVTNNPVISTNQLGPVSVSSHPHSVTRSNTVGHVTIHGQPIVSLVIDAKERLCLAQISTTLLKGFSYNEIHNRRVALGEYQTPPPPPPPINDYRKISNIRRTKYQNLSDCRLALQLPLPIHRSQVLSWEWSEWSTILLPN